MLDAVWRLAYFSLGWTLLASSDDREQAKTELPEVTLVPCRAPVRSLDGARVRDSRAVSCLSPVSLCCSSVESSESGVMVVQRECETWLHDKAGMSEVSQHG